MSDCLRPHGLCTVHGILQARILEWVAFPFSRGSPTQELNPGLLDCRQILYQLSHEGSPRILVWVAYSFSSRSSWPRNRTGVSCIAGRFFTRLSYVGKHGRQLQIAPGRMKGWAKVETMLSYRCVWW